MHTHTIKYSPPPPPLEHVRSRMRVPILLSKGVLGGRVVFGGKIFRESPGKGVFGVKTNSLVWRGGHTGMDALIYRETGACMLMHVNYQYIIDRERGGYQIHVLQIALMFKNCPHHQIGLKQIKYSRISYYRISVLE